MSKNWKVGDVAIKVRVPNEIRDLRCAPLVYGRAYRVEDVFPHSECLVLVLAGHHSSHWTKGYNALSFRKLRPADPEFIEQLAATKRPVRAEERIDG